MLGKAGRKLRLLSAARLAVMAGLICAACPSALAEQAQAKATPEQWQAALKAVREVALDGSGAVEHRSNAVMAYAKLQSLRGQYGDAINTAWEVLKAATSGELAGAAVRAACFASRQQHGHFGGPVALIEDWKAKAPSAPAKAALEKVRLDVARICQHVMRLVGKKMTPEPVRTGLPAWAQVRPNAGVQAVNLSTPKIATPPWLVIQKDRGPSALQVAVLSLKPSPEIAPDPKTRIPQALKLNLPVYSAPAWYGRVDFPLLKEPKK